MRCLRDTGADFRLHIIGEDTLGGRTQRAVRDAGLDAIVTFHGFLPNGELRLLVEQADLLVMSSRHEAAEMVTLEAAAVGVPAVGTATGRIGEWAPAEAVAVRVGDHEALGRAVHRLLADEPSRLAIAHAAHRRALREDADATADRVLTLYECLTRRAA
jgi:glycosyltransferase involved in cell wall biosynthesis